MQGVEIYKGKPISTTWELCGPRDLVDGERLPPPDSIEPTNWSPSAAAAVEHAGGRGAVEVSDGKLVEVRLYPWISASAGTWSKVSVAQTPTPELAKRS
jgi:hypothetical protein